MTQWEARMSEPPDGGAPLSDDHQDLKRDRLEWAVIHRGIYRRESKLYYIVTVGEDAFPVAEMSAKTTEL